jgi:hypothetical protein
MTSVLLPKAEISSALCDVRFVPKADMGLPLIDVRFTPKSGHCRGGVSYQFAYGWDAYWGRHKT